MSLCNILLCKDARFILWLQSEPVCHWGKIMGVKLGPIREVLSVEGLGDKLLRGIFSVC